VTGHIQCAAKKDPLKQISLFLVYFNILLRNFQRLFWTQFAIIVANFFISTFVVRSSTSLNIKDDFFMHRQINQTTTNLQAYFKHNIRLNWNAAVISRWKQKYQLLNFL